MLLSVVCYIVSGYQNKKTCEESEESFWNSILYLRHEIHWTPRMYPRTIVGLLENAMRQQNDKANPK